MSHGVKIEQSEGELHPRGEQQGEETGGADQPTPTTLRIEMRSHTGDIYA